MGTGSSSVSYKCALCVHVCECSVTVQLTDISPPSSKSLSSFSGKMLLTEDISTEKSALNIAHHLRCLLNICALSNFFFSLKKEQHKKSKNLSLKLRSTVFEVTVCCEIYRVYERDSFSCYRIDPL